MKDMAASYNKNMMVIETGMSEDQADACRDFLMEKVKSISNNRGRGVLYWEPEAYTNWKGYTLGAFDNEGKPTLSLDAFK
jgi:arabinogalactan endo-1,4-beta-galactosidase